MWIPLGWIPSLLPAVPAHLGSWGWEASFLPGGSLVQAAWSFEAVPGLPVFVAAGTLPECRKKRQRLRVGAAIRRHGCGPPSHCTQGAVGCGVPHLGTATGRWGPGHRSPQLHPAGSRVSLWQESTLSVSPKAGFVGEFLKVLGWRGKVWETDSVYCSPKGF